MSRLQLTAAAAALVAAWAAIPARDEPQLLNVATGFTMARADARLGDVLDELEKQVGVQFSRDRTDQERKLKVDFDKVPFWTALERIARDADHRLRFAGEGRKVALSGGETYHEPPLSVDGMFRCSATRVTATRDLEQDQAGYELAFDVHWEPKFQAFLVQPPGEGLVVKDNAGKDIEIAAAGTGRVSVSGGGVSLQVRMQGVPRSAKAIKLMEGQFKVVGSPGMISIPFGELKKDEQEVTKNGVTAKLRVQIDAADELWTARINLQYPDEGPELESFEGSAWLAENRVYLLSKDGKRKVPCNGGEETGASSARSAQLVYRWIETEDVKLGRPTDWSLVVVTPMPMVEMPVKFKFQDIELP